jgi:hypothetical protein
MVDNNRNIQAALCHGTKSTSLVEERRSLDIAVKPTQMTNQTKLNKQVRNTSNTTARVHKLSFNNILSK